MGPGRRSVAPGRARPATRRPPRRRHARRLRAGRRMRSTHHPAPARRYRLRSRCPRPPRPLNPTPPRTYKPMPDALVVATPATATGFRLGGARTVTAADADQTIAAVTHEIAD